MLRTRLLAATTMLLGLGPVAWAQDAATPTLGRPGGGLAAPLGGAGASGSSGLGLGLRPGLQSPGPGRDPERLPQITAQAPISRAGAAVRPGLRPAKTRRSRQPTSLPVAGPFRATIAPPTVAVDVQPIQTGIPEPVIAGPLPGGPPPALAAGAAPPGAVPPGAVGIGPPPVRRKPVVDDPYAPLGVRAGGLTLYPMIGESLGYDTNPNRTRTNRRPSFLSQTEGELRIQSDWSRHELSGALRGAYNEYPSNPEASRPEGAGRLGFRYDISRDTQVDIEGHYLIDTQRPDSPDLGVSVRERPIVATEGTSLGLTQRFNRLILTLRGTVDRSDYETARLTNGRLLDQSDRNLTQYGGKLRLGYELKPGLTPFVEVLGDTRDYDRRIDSSGFARSSDGFGGRLGSTFEITRLLTGEVAAGAIHRQYEDKRLKGLTSPIAEASLTYALSPLTTIRATGQAAVDETTIPNATGIRTLKGGLEIAHDLRRNVTLTAAGTLADYQYQGVKLDEHSFGATLRADWRMNRNVTLRASYGWEKLVSSVPASSYVSNVFLLGLRLQP